jgi:hypothetical protein
MPIFLSYHGHRTLMKPTLALVGVMGVAAIAASPAFGAIFIRLATVHVHRAGRVRIVGNAAHMRLYALPVRKMPCVEHGTCAGFLRRAKAPSGRPFVLLGRAPGVSSGMTSTRAFTVRLPRALHAGKYVVFVWCASCGGSLISAGTNPSGQPQTLIVRP